MLRIIKQRTQAAYRQTIQGNKKLNNKGIYKVKSPHPKSSQNHYMKPSKSMNYLGKTKINKVNTR